jgi:pterin-4a-carbinolamine dehydratase
MGKNKKDKQINLTPEQLKGWEEYRKSLYLQKTKSDDQFEKAITFISSGALGLTLTFNDKIVPSQF